MSPPSGAAARSAAPATSVPAASETWDVTKHSWWRGAYSRRLSVINGWLLTSDPATGRTTNAWRLADVAQVVRRPGTALEVRFAGCAAGCGPLAPALRLSLPNAPMAAALHANLSCTVLRQVKVEMHAANFELVASILDARPCELPPVNPRSVAPSPLVTPVRASPMSSPRASPPTLIPQLPGEGGVRAASGLPESSHDGSKASGSSSRFRPPPLAPLPPHPPREVTSPRMQPLSYRSSGAREASRDDDDAGSLCSEDFGHAARARDPELTFDVQITVQKARKLRPPPPLSGPPRVAVWWGVPPHAPRPAPSPAAPGGPSDASAPSRADSSLGSRDFGTPGGGLCRAALSSSLSGVPVADPAFGDSSARDAVARRPVCFETPPGEDDPASPRWSAGASFEYSASLAQLGSTVLRLELDHVRLAPLRPSPIGACEVRLSDIASGPIKYDLPVLDAAGLPCGRLVFTVRMMQKCVLAVTIPWARATMRSLQRHTSEASQKASHRDADFTLTAALTMEDDECEPMRVDFDSSSLHLLDGAQVQVQYHESPSAPRPAIEAEASASAFANESLHLEVLLSSRAAAIAPARSPSLDSLGSSGAASFGSAGARSHRDRQDRLRGEVWLPMTKVYTPADKRHATTEFDEVLWKNGQRVGRLSGCVVVHHGPRVVQLPGGFYTEHGIVPVGPVAFDSSSQRLAAPAKGTSPSHARICAFLGGDSPGATRPPSLADSDVPPSPNGARAGARGDVPLLRPPPKGTCLPKQIEALVALVQGLKQVILELHTTRADEPPFGSPSEEPPDSPPAEQPPPASDDEEEDDFADHPDGPARQRGAGHSANGGAAALAARRLAMLCQRMQVLLSSSHKESVRSFFYPSPEGLAYTQLLLIRLWAHLLKQVDHLPHRHQGCLFATLTPLTLRGELSPSALLSAPTQLLEKYAHVLWATVGYVTSKLNRKAATSEVRTFCSHALAIAFFRLPRLRPTLLAIILPPGENRFKHVREWNLPWSLHKAALKDGRGDTYATATEPKANVPPPRVSTHADPHHSGGTSFRSISPLTASRFSMHIAPASAASEPLDAWAVLWMSQGLAKAVPQPEVDRNLSGKYWRDRLRKRGHCFFLFLEHWARHAALAVGTQPDECTNWREVPGYAVLVKAFLLEMRQRPVTLWPESLRSCMAALVIENRSLTQVFARILVSAASGTSLRRTLVALQRLSELMTLATDEAFAAAQQQSSGFILATPSAPALYGAGFGAGFGGTTAGGAFGGGGFGGGGFSGGAVGGRDTAEAHSYDLALHQIKYLLASQHFKVVGCALIFLYNHLDRLGDERRLQVLGWIHDSMFGTLALHWSRVVRSSFMHIVVLKVQHGSDPALQPPSKRRIVERAASLDREGASSAAADLLAPSLGRRGIGASNSVPSGLHLGLPSEADELSDTFRRPIPTSHSMTGRSDSILSSSSATKLSKLALYDAESSLLQAAFEESLRLVQALAESSDGSTVAVEAAEQLGLGVAGEAAAVSDRLATWQSYARHAWAEHNALQHKWEEMREMQSRYPDAPADEGAGRRTNGSAHHAGQAHAHVGAPQRRHLTLSMAGLCESSDEDDEEGSSDEW